MVFLRLVFKIVAVWYPRGIPARPQCADRAGMRTSLVFPPVKTFQQTRITAIIHAKYGQKTITNVRILIIQLFDGY